MTQIAETKATRLHDWFVNYISYFRSECERLTPEEKELVTTNANYIYPCQIEVFWLREPEYQLIVKTNYPDRPDMEIIVNGPYDSHEFINKIDQVLHEHRWSRAVENSAFGIKPSGEVSYAEVLASQLHRFISYVKDDLFRPETFKGHQLGQLIGIGAWIDMFAGDIGALDYVAEVNSTIHGIKSQLESYKRHSQTPSEPTPSKPRVPDGYGVYLFPPIVVGKMPKLSPSETLRGRTSRFSGYEKAFDTKFNEFPVIINKDGFILVAIPQKDLALKVLNTIMAVGTLVGLDLYAVREHELVEVSYNKETMTLNGYSFSATTMRSTLFEERFGQSMYTAYQRVEVSEDIIRNMIKVAAEIFRTGKLLEELRLLVEANTHLNDTEYGQSFVMSWSIIERHISESWRKRLNEKDLDGQRMGKLLNTTQWSTDYLLEVLNLTGEISESDYDVFMEMKGKRNKFVHQGRQIAKEDAERCFGLASRIIKEKLNLPN